MSMDDATRLVDDYMSGRSRLPVAENMTAGDLILVGSEHGYHFNEDEITEALLRRADVVKTMA